MKRLLLILSFVLLAAGCRHADKITVEPEDANADLEVTSLLSVADDTTKIPLDSIAVLPSELNRFAGAILLSSVRLDAGGEVRNGAFSWVYMGDLARPYMMSGRTFGYYGLNLGSWMSPLTVNMQPMLRIPHKIRALDTTVIRGFEYIRDMSGEYQANALFHWQVSPDTIGLVEMSITSPDSLQVLFPKGGTRLSHTKDIVLRWIGSGNLSVVIGSVNPLTKRSRPLLYLHPRINKGYLVVSANLLTSLATQGRFFSFSFILANRKETTVLSRYTGSVLIQAATVYNSYIELI